MRAEGRLCASPCTTRANENPPFSTSTGPPEAVVAAGTHTGRALAPVLDRAGA